MVSEADRKIDITLTLQQRVELGNLAKWWVKELNLETNQVIDQSYFWQEFVTELQRRNIITTPQQSEGLTDQQGEEYGKRLCPFNQYKDIAYRAVPYDYLAFIVDSNKSLESYLKWRMKKGMTQ